MIPELGMAICAYMVYRILDTLLIGYKRYNHNAAHVVSAIAGGLAIVFICLIAFALLITSAATPTNSLPR